MTTESITHPSPDQPILQPGLVEALTQAYATLIKRQRTASAAFVRWSSPHKRSHEFAWLEPGTETLLRQGKDLRVDSSSPTHDSINKMMATIELNPYERELLYGYPYLVGHVQGIPIRAPILTMPITITTNGASLLIHPNEEQVRFNSLPFRSEFETAARELALARLIEATPTFPLRDGELRSFCESVVREMKVLLHGKLDGSLSTHPPQPRAEAQLAIVDNAACFVAPKTSYFLASDLERIGKKGAAHVAETAVGWLIGKRPHEATSNIFDDTRKVFFPFSSNPSQRRVALLADDLKNRLIVVQGPPGTGKSQTIANVACHLIANGRRVLITSQKDKALEVVDNLLRGLGFAQLPMTLLRQDRESKAELRERLGSIQKTRATDDTKREQEREESRYRERVEQVEETERKLQHAIIVEHHVAEADKRLALSEGWLPRFKAWLGFKRALRVAERTSPHSSDVLSLESTKQREELLTASLTVLHSAAEHRVADASKSERNHLREFSKLLGRNQTSAKNFSVFDRMKNEPERCHMLLKILPCWIMTPDDVARLFPCESGLFDTVIIDEASQCDLPSMTPVLYRAKQAIIAGDSKQMQAQRFAFTSNQVAAQAWREHGLEQFDPDRWLDPAKVDLLQLASIRMDEESFLDEHYRSLPPIIQFSNQRWYGGRLRLMRDHDDRRFGEHDGPIITLHHVPDGTVQPGTQDNEREAALLVEALRSHLKHPGYADASFGVICLFEEQMRLMSDLIAEHILEEDRVRHELVVVNPDGFQGDERDVIYYSLSYDAIGMEQAALSARQADRDHIQGMLNVAFTRARDEMHIFHTAKIDEFVMATGEGVIHDWLRHCGEKPKTPCGENQERRAESEFEAQVIQALAAKGIKAVSQYASCGYFIDIVAEVGERRIAIECDGERWHLDEHGQLKIEDLQRQEILERAGWTVLRVPYRGWLRKPDDQVRRILEALEGCEEEEADDSGSEEGKPLSLRLSIYEAAIINALKEKPGELEAIFKEARSKLGYARLGIQVRRALENAVAVLESRRLIFREENELFLADAARNTTISSYTPSLPPTATFTRSHHSRYRSYRRYRRRRS